MTLQQPPKLFPPGEYPSYGAYLKEAWRRRDFAVAMGRTRVLSANAEMRLGTLWLLIEPLIFAGTFALVFGAGLRGGRAMGEDVNFVSWLLVGIVFFRYTQQGVTQNANAIKTGRSLMKAFTFPKILLVFAGELDSAIRLAVSLLPLLAVFAWQGEWPTLRWLLLPVFFAGQLMMNIGMAAALARAVNRLPDVSQGLNQITRLFYFTSMIMFPLEMLEGANSKAIDVFVKWLPANPFYSFVHLYRWALIDYQSPNMTMIVVSCVAWASICFFAGIRIFYGGEAGYSIVRAR